MVFIFISLMMLIFSCTCWPSVCLWENVYSNLLPISMLNFFFFCYWVASVLHAFWVLAPYQIYDFHNWTMTIISVFNSPWWTATIPVYITVGTGPRGRNGENISEGIPVLVLQVCPFEKPPFSPCSWFLSLFFQEAD